MQRLTPPLLVLILGLGASCGDKEDTAPVDFDGDGHDTRTDCDDGDEGVHPGATETPYNGVDDDCDPTTPDDDLDGDGVLEGTDCDDTDAAVFPGAEEICNGVDDDCDGEIDVGAADASLWYADADGDGYGDTSDTGTEACERPAESAAEPTDCDDGDPMIHPAAAERCNGLDDDCDGDVDENAGLEWYADTDGDGFGDASTSTVDCDGVNGFVADSTDCDDGEAGVHPGADELCNDRDDDCDGAEDENAVDATTWYADADGDGYGNPTSGAPACDQPRDTVNDGTDCDDGDASAHPGAVERCDGTDNDCDGFTDEGDAIDATGWYLDLDGDGYGDDSAAITACDQPSNAVADGGDCDDSDASVNPGATETWYDGIDGDCAGGDDFDADADGYQHEDFGGGDCNDSDASVNPGATEVFYDGVDSDCSGDSDFDADGDGYDSTISGGEDCDDSTTAVHPGATELDPAVDNDCDGEVEVIPVAVPDVDPSSVLEHCTEVILDGTASYDPDGTALEYLWSAVSVPSGSGIGTADLDDNTSPLPSYEPDLPGTYQWLLTVTDEGETSGSATLDVIVAERRTNTPPRADAGSDSYVYDDVLCPLASYTTGEYACPPCDDQTVTLDATASFDIEPESLSYLWTVISGSATIRHATSATAYADLTGIETEIDTTAYEDFVFQVEVTDCFGDTDTARVTVTFSCEGQ